MTKRHKTNHNHRNTFLFINLHKLNGKYCNKFTLFNTNEVKLSFGLLLSILVDSLLFSDRLHLLQGRQYNL